MKRYTKLGDIYGRLRYNFVVEWYNLRYLLSPRKQSLIPEVASVDDTIASVVEHRYSVSRFGDGEILLTVCKSIGFQHGDKRLAARLKEILVSDYEGHIVCISDIFGGLNRYNRKARRFWRTHLLLYGHLWEQQLLPGKRYYNTFMTRPYMDFSSKALCGQWFASIKRIWEGRDIVFIEGEKSRLGVGNDLFDNVNSIRRILCPARNAFDHYEEILQTASKQEKGILFLIALGPTASVLAYDLHKEGYQAIDVGHVDVEYEWWRMGANRKVKLPQKYVNEVSRGHKVGSPDEKYMSQIIAHIRE